MFIGLLTTFFGMAEVQAAAPDQKAELEELTVQCDANNYASCTELGNRYFGGFGTEPNESKAMEYYEKACTGNHADGCVSVAYMYMPSDDDGVRQTKTDPAKAQSYFDKAYTLQKVDCEKGIMSQCTATGVMMTQGIGLPKDVDTATAAAFSDSGMEYLKKACEGKEPIACETLELYKAIMPPDANLEGGK